MNATWNGRKLFFSSLRYKARRGSDMKTTDSLVYSAEKLRSIIYFQYAIDQINTE